MSGNAIPASTTTISSSNSIAVMFFPISPTPPKNIILSLPREAPFEVFLRISDSLPFTGLVERFAARERSFLRSDAFTDRDLFFLFAFDAAVRSVGCRSVFPLFLRRGAFTAANCSGALASVAPFAAVSFFLLAIYSPKNNSVRFILLYLLYNISADITSNMLTL